MKNIVQEIPLQQTRWRTLSRNYVFYDNWIEKQLSYIIKTVPETKIEREWIQNEIWHYLYMRLKSFLLPMVPVTI